VWKTEILLGGYLRSFATAAKRSLQRTFIDCFAGVTENIQHGTDRNVPSSAKLALATDPQFTHVLLFETPARAAALDQHIASTYPGRTCKVFGGDCNALIGDALEWWRSQGAGPNEGPHLGATLAYLDPDAVHLRWKTVETLGTFLLAPPRGVYKRKRPIELLINFPTGPMRRRLSQSPKPRASEADLSAVDDLFGNQDWRRIYDDQRGGVIGGDESWRLYVEQYRYQLAHLGYRYTSAIEVRNTRNVMLYHMVFATDNDAGARIMKAIQQRARSVLPTMIDDERARRRAGQGARLFETEDDAGLESIAQDPARWAHLLDSDPQPYVSGTPTPAGGTRPTLFEA
jgi:three-Cys-motif partner protein